MKKICDFIKREAVLTTAWVLALFSIIFMPPDRGYLEYIDFHTLMLLFSLMAVMAGLQNLGLFRQMGERLLGRTGTTRQLEGALIFLPFFTSMLVTNDVALITFVPFAIEVLKMSGREKRLIPVVVMQTIAANLGSMTTPVGNPQNLYLYSHYGLNLTVFFCTLLPLTIAAACMMVIFLMIKRSHPLSLPEIKTSPEKRSQKVWIYVSLFLVCLCAVARQIPVWAAFTAVLAFLLVADRSVLKKVDYSLLLTFVGFFVFVGNLGRLGPFREFVCLMLDGHEVICAVLASQVLSNVPAALLLSGFTQNGTALLAGTNLGGLGTLIASMASLISFKQIARSYPDLCRPYLVWFTLANIIFLIILLALFFLINV